MSEAAKHETAQHETAQHEGRDDDQFDDDQFDDDATELFEGLPLDDDEAYERLHARLADAAGESQVLDVAYRTLETRLGELLLAATPAGLVRVAYDREDHGRVLVDLAHRVSPRVLLAPRRLDEAAREIDEYLDGRRRSFDLQLDLQLSHGFRRLVLDHLPDIEYGHTASYSDLARAAGSPGAVRAVGTACATNPLPVVVPCHRVVRRNGSIGQYIGGAEAKQALLTMEGHPDSPLQDR